MTGRFWTLTYKEFSDRQTKRNRSEGIQEEMNLAASWLEASQNFFSAEIT
jgi:hypothetical protein